MLFASEFGTGQVFWSILWFFLFFLWIWLVITIFSDVMRNRDLSGWGKALWAIGIIVLPFLGVFLYLIVNGSSMNQRAEADARDADEAAQAYIRQAVGTSASPSEELSKLADLHSDGKLTDAEYEQAKAKVFAS
jgi:hypothetical protein